MLRFLPAALTLLALILLPAQAHAAKGMEMALQDDAVFLWESGMDLDAALDHAVDLRTKRIRVNVLWSRLLVEGAESRHVPAGGPKYDFHRIDILEAEIGRRERGDSLEDLINDLPRILADPGPRGDPVTSRLPMQLAPMRDSEWDPRVAEFEGTLANLPGLSADELTRAIDGLRALEREVSDQRRALFGVIDRIDLLLAERLKAQ